MLKANPFSVAAALALASGLSNLPMPGGFTVPTRRKKRAKHQAKVDKWLAERTGKVTMEELKKHIAK